MCKIKLKFRFMML